MAVYGAMVITNRGMQLYSKVQSGVQLNFTRMQIGSGQLSGQDPITLTALIAPISFFAINSITSSGSTAAVKGIFSNTSITIPTYSCELGLFAQDPDIGEILYAYANAGTQGDTIPPYSSGPFSRQFQINAAIGNATNVTATIPAGTYIPVTEKGAASGVAPLDSGSKVPVANLPDGTVSAKGAVQLSTSTSSTSTTLAATPSAVKAAKDVADAAVPKAGGVMTGPLQLPGDPTLGLQAAPKQYVDAKTASLQAQLNAAMRELANQKAVSALKDRTDGASGIFYDLFDGLNGGSIAKLDTTKTKTTAALTSGNTILTGKVESTAGFKVGQEITIMDDTGYERVTVTLADTTSTGTNTQTNVTVTANAYDTSGNGGRKVTVLSNGWIVAAANDSSTGIKFYKSSDNGATFTQLCTVPVLPTGGFAIASTGTIVYCIVTTSASINNFYRFDATTVTNTNQAPISNLDSGQTAQGACSIAVAPDGSLHAVWVSKNATYPNSFNIRYSKSTDNGTTWATPTQMSVGNTTGADYATPCVVVKSNNNPVIVFQYSSGTTWLIRSFVWNGSSWSSENPIYSIATYAQYSPCAAIAPNGRIWCVWYGYDATDSAKTNVRIKYSDDGGATWVNGGVSAEKLTSGNVYNQNVPTISIDKNGNVYVLWYGIDSAVSSSLLNIRRIVWNGTSWGSITTLTSNTTAQAVFPASIDNNTLDFTDPLCIYKDDQASAVKFRGSWTTTITTSQLQTTATTRAFKVGSWVYRSLGQIDPATKMLTFSPGYVSSTTYTRTNVTVVASAYDTSGNGGRKVTVLSNGWIVAAVYDSGSTQIKFFVSKDNGGTWTQLCYRTGNPSAGFAIASFGTNVFLLYAVANSTTNIFSKFDATTVTNTDIPANIFPDSGQTSINNGCSIAVAPDGSLHAAWCSKNATYPNSNNIRYSKSTDGGATWATPTQMSAINTNGTDFANPCIVVRPNNYPVVFYQYSTSGGYEIGCWFWNGSSFTIKSISGSTTFSQSNPCAAIAPNGRIWCAWYGMDATDSAQWNVHIKYTDDGGTTWVNGNGATDKLTSGNVYSQLKPTLSSDKNGNVYVDFQGYDAAISTTYTQIRRIIWNGTSWGSITSLTNNTTVDSINPSSVDNNTLNFTDPLTIYADNAAAVKFRGSWTTGTTTPVLVEDVRYNIMPAANISSIVTWGDHETDAGFSLSAAGCIHNGTENMQSMTKTTAPIDGSTSEDQFVLSGQTPAAKGTQRITMARTSTSINKGVKQVTGYVS